MFAMLRLVFTLLICILLVGLVFGWFTFHRLPPDPQSNRVNINVSVDEKKMGSDLHTFEQKVANRIQDINNQPQGNTQSPPSGQRMVAPGLNIGPISVRPIGQGVPSTNGQPRRQPGHLGRFPFNPPASPLDRRTVNPPGRRSSSCRHRDSSSACRWGAPPPGEGR